YTLFLQHIIYSLNEQGKAAVVVPTGFITAQSGIDKAIRTKLVDEKMLAGVVSMPSNIFATTGTNVSILFIDKANTRLCGNKTGRNNHSSFTLFIERINNML
ncbi:MAG: N-6 DNA methylase, partial [Nostocales cyanobacterium W4_Combined_metabat2_030]|nr:N-6 DNA methylase [Nostocales cyanobacterium W4_Combined_metabat2_030]